MGFLDDIGITNGYQAPAPTPGTDPAQLKALYDQSQAALAQQNAFVQALQAQGGIGNQTSVFNQQQALANQLQGVANGTGPNPAQAALNQATGQNVANQAALMGSQRGAGSNVGLLARQAAQQGGAIQQQAAGQSALMQAQQQLAGMQALQGQQANMANLATTQVGQQANNLNAFNQNTQNEQGILQNANAGYNNALNNQSAINAGISRDNTATTKGYWDSGMKTIGGGLMSMMGGGGGGAAAGGGGGGSSIGAPSGGSTMMPHTGGAVSNNETLITPKSHVTHYFKNKGQMPMQGGQSAMMKSGGTVNGEMLAAQGKVVPGQAKVKGDSLKNDTVNAKLSPGEIVIPRHITQGSNPADAAAKFVAAILAKQGKGLKRG